MIPGFSFERGDAADMLPEPAASKLRLLDQLRADARGALEVAMTALQELTDERRNHQARRKQLVGYGGTVGGYGLLPDDPAVVAIDLKIAKISTDVERRQEIEAVRTARWETAARLIRQIEDWVRSGRPAGTTIVPIEAEPPTLKRGEGLLDAIEGRRRRLRELAADAHQIESRPLPSSVAKAHMRQQVERWAEAGAPAVEAAIWLNDDVEFPKSPLRSEVRLERDLALAFGEVHDPVHLLAWFDKDRMIARLDAEIMASADDTNALSTDEKARQLAVIASDALAVEREEEALICLASASGTEIARRIDASPRAVLEVELLNARPSTSPPPLMSIVQKVIG